MRTHHNDKARSVKGDLKTTANFATSKRAQQKRQRTMKLRRQNTKENQSEHQTTQKQREASYIADTTYLKNGFARTT